MLEEKKKTKYWLKKVNSWEKGRPIEPKEPVVEP